jgi:hypothetical protein
MDVSVVDTIAFCTPVESVRSEALIEAIVCRKIKHKREGEQ